MVMARWDRYCSGFRRAIESEEQSQWFNQAIRRHENPAESLLHGSQDNTIPEKSVAKSPSNALAAALERGEHKSAVPGRFRNKLDHTHIAPLPLDRRHPKRLRHCQKCISSKARVKTRVFSMRVPQLKLQHILTRYLNLLHSLNNGGDSNGKVFVDFGEASDKGILQVFNKRAISSLQLKGYDPNDVQVWAWILTAKTSLVAAFRLLAVSSQSHEFPDHKVRHIPTFVFLFLLRRTQMTTQALRLLVIHAWQRLGKSDTSQGVLTIRDLVEDKEPQSQRYQRNLKRPIEYVRTYPKMSEPTIVVMVIRLLRHSRKLWPAAFASISAMITTQVNAGQGSPSPHKSVILDETTSSRLSFLYNKVLYLLSLPSSQHPYRAVPYHQRAQFNIISRMNEFVPALAINREGYRAVVSVQLAHRKTIQEREWARMKAKSWPPWKEEKLGIDADVDIESGISRANKALSRLSEAGYGSQSWEATAKVLSGWDTDRSPTIQTRTILGKFAGQHLDQSKIRFLKDAESDGNVWAARIRATRTLHEGWACFLAYKDQKAPRSLAVYHAMLEKLMFDAKRCQKIAKGEIRRYYDTPLCNTAAELSGEGKELVDLPTDPRDGIYVRTLPPNLDEFFDMMVSDQVQPSGRCLAFLLSHARSLSDGVKYLKSSSLSPGVISLLVGCKETEIPRNKGLLKQLPDIIFASHIRLLCRFGSTNLAYEIDATNETVTSRENRGLPSTPLMQAFHLLNHCRPAYRPPWYSLLSALTRSKVRLRDNAPIQNVNGEAMATWNAMLHLVDQMQEAGIELDFGGFHKLCIGFEKAFLAAEQTLAKLRQQILPPINYVTTSNAVFQSNFKVRDCSRLEAEEITIHGPRKLKAMFKRLAVFHSGDEGMATDTPEYLIPDSEPNSLVYARTLLPRLLEVPSPAEVHALIRVLGLSRDYNGLHTLILWMAHYAPELKVVADELRNGSELMRRCLVATRAFVDGSWYDLVTANGVQAEVTQEESPNSFLERVYMAIEGVEDWGGWPTDEEVENYCKASKLFGDRKSVRLCRD